MANDDKPIILIDPIAAQMALDVIESVRDYIHAARTVSRANLYAVFAKHGIQPETFNGIIRLLALTGHIRQTEFTLEWIEES